MTSSADQSGATTVADFTQTWRYKVGLGLIIFGNLGILAAVLMGFVGLGAATVGALVVGGEIVSLASIVFLGKEGFKAIKSKAVAFVKTSYTAPVGKTRHYIGIALLCTSVLTTYIMMIYAWDAFAAATAEGPTAAVWGLDIAQQGDLVFSLFLTGEIAFLISLYVLGADWWGKFRRIFVWESAQS
ncbi:MAG: hypothetical protein QNI91_13900 [Arenicellales bacterium]|nr:hypothetical protein [Arenicellales bacterium]